MQLQGMDLNSLFLNTIDYEAIKSCWCPPSKLPFQQWHYAKNCLDLLIKVMLITSHIIKPVSCEVEISKAEILSFSSTPL